MHRCRYLSDMLTDQVSWWTNYRPVHPREVFLRAHSFLLVLSSSFKGSLYKAIALTAVKWFIPWLALRFTELVLRRLLQRVLRCKSLLLQRH